MITRRDLAVAAIALSLGGTVMALAQSTASPLMHSSIFNWADLKFTKTTTGERRSVFDAETPALANLECHITTLNPGMAPHPPHHHPEEELMIIKAGTLESVQEGRTNIVTAGGIIFQASNEQHGLRNTGTDDATYYVIKFVPHDLKR